MVAWYNKNEKCAVYLCVMYYEKYVQFISDKTYTNMHHIISDAVFCHLFIWEQRHLYIHFMYFALYSTYKAYYFFWTRMKSMRILGRDNVVVAHQTHFKPSNLTIFSSMDLKIYLTQRNEVQQDNFINFNIYKTYIK